jgi:NTP pyrophosphatase (non-canonical NTP hydrolase)
MKQELTLNQYQTKAESTFISSPDVFLDELRLTFGILGESGEIAEKYKKFLRGDDIDEEQFKEGIAKELGDVLWYVAVLSLQLGFSLDDIATKNIAKLSDRKERGVLKGSGDSR